ncbi:sugar phosphate isomerase/epimerase family protein [Aureibacillus halotolerans]|uniref:Sugar phosphate isomerase/epimerase n=1 Tax=Aureibacillus halotolerans TaxID=1508390 RepID=A0A4R6TX29_9BACI|nr:sugar phosphate isomerase/epimerase [Aureibacillus halotolerans]TDQ33762.1 sugar phosphate isomerase/epimerase [Aureibacillus halotolerans]
MKIGISRPSWKTGENEEIVRFASMYPFDGIQLKPHQYEPLKTDADELRKSYGEAAYLAQGGMIVYPSLSYQKWPNQFDQFFSFMKGVGGKQVCVCAGLQKEHLDDTGVKGLATILNELGKRANDAGAVLSLHNHADTILESVEDIYAVFDTINPDYCGLTFDTAHAAKGGMTDLADALQQFKPLINNIHLKDLSKEGSFTVLGRGTLDLASVCRTVKEWSYDDWLIVDEETRDVSVEEAFSQSVNFLQAQKLMTVE